MSDEVPSWHVCRQEISPKALRLSELEELARSGALTQHDLVCHTNWHEWVAAADVSELALAFGHSIAGKTKATKNEQDDESTSRSGQIAHKLVHEIVSYAAITAFLLIVLLLLKLYGEVLLDQYGIRPENKSSLLVNALILGKVILIAEVIRLGNRVSFFTPIFSIVLRSFLFALALFSFHVLEHLVVAYWHGKPLLSSLSEFGNLKRDIAVVVIMTIALFPYHGFKELQKITGNTKLFSHLFGVRRRS